MGEDMTRVGQSQNPKPLTTISGGSATAATEQVPATGWLSYFLRRRWLDQKLAGGTEPSAHPLLQRRAAELSSAAHRAKLARTYRRMLLRADAPPLVGLLPVNWDGVRAGRARIRHLAERLSDPSARPRGLAMAELMLTDGTSPLYRFNEERQLDNALRQTLSAL